MRTFPARCAPEWPCLTSAAHEFDPGASELRGPLAHGEPGQSVLPESASGTPRQQEQLALILPIGGRIEVFERLASGHAAALAEGGSAPGARDGSKSPGSDLKEHGRRLILGALEEGRGSCKFAAEKLGIRPRSLHYKVVRTRDAEGAVPGN